MAILLTSDHHLIEFPSLLLPTGVLAGSIIDLSVSQNVSKEKDERNAFVALQKDIHNLFATHVPSTPELTVRNVTQTSVVLEWNLLDLATAEMRSLSLYKNGSKLGKIPNATTTTTKLSGLALDTEYSFQLVLRTSAGTFKSNELKIKTHKMTNLTGLNICVSNIRPEERERVSRILTRIGAKPLHERVRIDTTHFVTNRGMGDEYKKAQALNIPIVVPDFVEACEAEGRIMRVGSYYLDSDPALRSKRISAPDDSSQANGAQSTEAAAESTGLQNLSEVLPTKTTALNEADVGDADLRAREQGDAEEPTTENRSKTPEERNSIVATIVDAAQEITDKGKEGVQKLSTYLKDDDTQVATSLEGSSRESTDGQTAIASASLAVASDDVHGTSATSDAVMPQAEAAIAVEDLPSQTKQAEQISTPDSFPPSMGRGTTGEDMEEVAL